MCGTDYVKLGKASDVNRRLKEIQSHNPYELLIEHMIETNDPRDLETRCLCKLKMYRVRGEWYNIDIDTLTDKLNSIYLEHISSVAIRDLRKVHAKTWAVTLSCGRVVEFRSQRKHCHKGNLKLFDYDGRIIAHLKKTNGNL